MSGSGSQCTFVEELRPVRATGLQEMLESPTPARLSHLSRSGEVACQPDDRADQRIRLARRDEETRDAVLNELP